MRDAYDEVPYPHVSHVLSHPARLEVMARLLGLAPRPAREARILEIGCATGGNLVPIAAGLPGAEVLGLDASEQQVAAARDLAGEIGTENLTLRRADVRDLGADLGTFDYVLAHGVYSWVPPDARAALLRLVAEVLAPDGLAYVSYNTLPGWGTRLTLREMMLYHAGRFEGGAERARQGRALLDVLARTTDPATPYGAVAREAAKRLGRESDAYVLHDDLGEVNAPVWFHEFAAQAGARGLAYVGDADLAAMMTVGLPEEVDGVLAALGGDLLRTEQYLDFIRNRAFRNTLLCHRDAAPAAGLDVSRLTGLRVASDLVPELDDLDPRAAGPVPFGRPGAGSIAVMRPLTKAVLCELARAAPMSVPFGELVVEAWRRVAEPGVAEPPAGEIVGLAQELLFAYAGRAIEILPHEPPLAPDVGERPVAFGPARVAAARGAAEVTNLRHMRVPLDGAARPLLARLDGTLRVVDLESRARELLRQFHRDALLVV